ncbi:hypothetical protein GCM10020367_61460 [Streptomyces sannanensis]|uniref:Serine protease n=1 Tax=Streptomyces sannanensis TaxID=285536 RepID=A0ABP6SKX5_9ACTN
MPKRSPVATRPEQIFADLRDVARRVRIALSEEMAESAEELPHDAAPARQVGHFAQLERARVLAAGVSGLDKLADGRADRMSDEEYFGVEAVVLFEGRPAIPIQGRDFAPQQGDWSVLNVHRAAIRESIGRVGRIEVTGHPGLDWAGTAFLVGPEAVMTNRHVAVEFARADGNGGWTFREGISARVDTAEEVGGEPGDGPPEFDITDVLGIHQDVDMALLRVAPASGTNPLPTPLAVAAEPPADVAGRRVYLIGYPAWDGRRNEPESMRRIFMDVYNVKRLQPGTATELVPDRLVVKHDCSTLGSNSGSPVIDLTDHRVLGLHFGGRYRVGNFAVPLWQLVDDPLLRRARVNFV